MERMVAEGVRERVDGGDETAKHNNSANPRQDSFGGRQLQRHTWSHLGHLSMLPAASARPPAVT
jgi:hypothetical protein